MYTVYSFHRLSLTCLSSSFKAFAVVSITALLGFPLLVTYTIGTLSNDDDDDGSENVSKKMNLLSFKLNRVYLDPLNMSSTGDFS